MNNSDKVTIENQSLSGLFPILLQITNVITKIFGMFERCWNAQFRKLDAFLLPNQQHRTK